MPTRDEQDFLLRQIRLVAEAIARALGLKRDGKTIAAREELDVAWKEMLGPLAPVVLRSDPATAGALIGDPRRLIALARLRAEQADLAREPAEGAPDPAAALWHDSWALGVTLEALARDPGTPDAMALLTRLLRLAPVDGLAPAHRATLARVSSHGIA